MTLRKRRGKAPTTTESFGSPASPPPKRTKKDKKATSSSSVNSIFKGELSYMKGAEFMEARKRYLSLDKLNIGIERFINEDDLDLFGVRDRVIELIVNGGFVGLWKMRGAVHVEIVKEMLANMELDFRNKQCQTCFRGRVFSMDFHEFAEKCGVYEGERDKTEEYDPQKFWTGNPALRLGMTRDAFWSELCCREGLKFVAGVSKISNVKDVAIRIVYKWLTKSICGRNSSDGAVYKKDLTCLFGMVKGITFDKAKLLIMLLDANRLRKKGDIYGGLFLSNFINEFYETLPGITINKPIEACSLRYLMGTKWRTEQLREINNSTPNVQPSEHHSDNPTEEAYHSVMRAHEKGKDTINERRAYALRKEQMIQRDMLTNLLDGMRWVTEETMCFFKKVGYCCSKPPPTFEGPPKINQEEFFRDFGGVEESVCEHQGRDKFEQREEWTFNRFDKTMGGYIGESARHNGV